MAPRYALKFEPAGGGSVVPAEAYVAAFEATLDGLASARNVIAPLLAARRRWPLAQVRAALELGVEATERGSVVVPIRIGTRAGDGHLDEGELGEVFWRTTGRLLRAVAGGPSASAELPAAGAEAFAKAARVAGDARCSLRLVHGGKTSARWTTTADLTALAPALREYTERRRVTRVARDQVVGLLATLGFEPSSIGVVTAKGRRTIRFPAELRDTVRKLWGETVIVDVEGNMNVEGDVSELRALAVRAVPRLDEDAFEKTRGAGKEVWAGEDARAYLEDLRGRGG